MSKFASAVLPSMNTLNTLLPGPWVLDARIHVVDIGSRLTMMLHYGGNFGVGLLERLLTDEIESSKPRLLALVEDGASAP